MYLQDIRNHKQGFLTCVNILCAIVEDWDALEQIWDHAFLKRLRCDPTEHPLIITEAAWNTREIREKLTELAFEKYNFPAFFVAKDAVMTA